MKNRWLFRRSCTLLAEDLIEWMLENHFKKDGFENREENLGYWELTMRYVSRKHMDLVTSEEDFKRIFNNYLTHHNLRRAINYGKELSK